MTSEDVDSFASMFKGPPGTEQREARKSRARKEKRTQLSPKQRKRGGVRTTQINFRCSPEFRDLASTMAKHLGCSIADVMEDALELLAREKNIEGPT